MTMHDRHPREHDLHRHPLAKERLWLTIVALCLVAPLTWLAGMPIGASFRSQSITLRSLAILIALVGLSAWTINLVLGARIPAIERYAGDLARMYRTHRLLGYSVPLLLFGHAGLMLASFAVISLGTTWDILWPSGPIGWSVTLGLIALVALFCILLLPLIARLPHQYFVLLHRLVGICFILGGLHILLDPGLAGLSLVLRVELFVLLGAGFLAYLYRSLLGRWLVQRHRCLVREVNHLGSQVIELVLEPQGRSISFHPGQFVFLSLADGEPLREAHPFSITSAPDDGSLRLVIKSLGDYTARLGDLAPGTAAWIEGPYGSFAHLAVENTRQIWIAGGIGVTPFLSMSRSLKPGSHDIDFYYCSDDREDAYFLDECFAISDRLPDFRVIPIHKRWLGFITADDIAGASHELAGKEIFICGPPVMIRNLDEHFRAMGVSRRQIHFEDFGVMSPGRASRAERSTARHWFVRKPVDVAIEGNGSKS